MAGPIIQEQEEEIQKILELQKAQQSRFGDKRIDTVVEEQATCAQRLEAMKKAEEKQAEIARETFHKYSLQANLAGAEIVRKEAEKLQEIHNSVILAETKLTESRSHLANTLLCMREHDQLEKTRKAEGKPLNKAEQAQYQKNVGTSLTWSEGALKTGFPGVIKATGPGLDSFGPLPLPTVDGLTLSRDLIVERKRHFDQLAAGRYSAHLFQSPGKEKSEDPGDR